MGLVGTIYPAPIGLSPLMASSLTSLIMDAFTQQYCIQVGLEVDAYYDIGIGEEHRDIIKQSFNAMVQAKSS